MSGPSNIHRIKPYYYVHVLNMNTNVTRVESGPKTFICKDHEAVVFGPEEMMIVPPRKYCVILNPAKRSEDGSPVIDSDGQILLTWGEREVRLTQDPFPLYPGEEIKKAATKLKTVKPNTALRIQAARDYDVPDGERRLAGDEWLFEGPGTYIPKMWERVTGEIQAVVIQENQALRLRATRNTKDRMGNKRVTGEEWLVREVGAYLPGAFEEVVDRGLVRAHVLTDKKAIHVKALLSFTDQFGAERKDGEKWLVTNEMTETYIPSVNSEVLRTVEITTLTSRQFAVVKDPYNPKTKKNELGTLKLVEGECSFFLHPGESIPNKIQPVYVLSEEQGLILMCNEAFEDRFVDKDGKEVRERRGPGNRWMIRGPLEYVPPVQVVVEQRTEAIPLDQNEGIYVRNIKSGEVRAVTGETYMLTEDEELWEKELPASIESMLGKVGRGGAGSFAEDGGYKRDKTRQVVYRVPHNALVQVYDFKRNVSRCCSGPDLIMLGPDEQFTPLSLSGGKPKRCGVIQSLHLMLGPDFCTDIIIVETSDHARLKLQLSYNWHFETDGILDDSEELSKLFSIADFVGDMCKKIASLVRGQVAAVPFDDFHKGSADIIRTAVFGFDRETKKIGKRFCFESNRLIVTGIDIQNVEPVDQKTRDALQKSVQLAIEITTDSQAQRAHQDAARVDQSAKAKLECQQLRDKAEAEKARKHYLELKAESIAVETTGQSKSEALSKADAALIAAKAEVEQAELRAKAEKIRLEADLSGQEATRKAELGYMRQRNELEIAKARHESELEIKKFKDMIDAIGPETIVSIACAGPEMQAKLLQGLNIQSTLITDGKSPINLFTTANGLISQSG